MRDSSSLGLHYGAPGYPYRAIAFIVTQKNDRREETLSRRHGFGVRHFSNIQR